MKKSLIFIFYSLILVGCGRYDENLHNSPNQKTYKYGVYIDNYATEFNLEDGTRCVATVKGGLDCDWNNK